MAKSTLRVEDLPAGNKGEYILTPKISRATNTHVGDVEKILQQKVDLYGDLWFTSTMCSTGVKFAWGPADELDVSDLTLVVDE